VSVPTPIEVEEVRRGWVAATELEHAVYLIARLCRALEAMAESAPHGGDTYRRKALLLADEGRALLELPVGRHGYTHGSELSLRVATWIAAQSENDLAETLAVPVVVFRLAEEFARDVVIAELVGRDLFTFEDGQRPRLGELVSLAATG